MQPLFRNNARVSYSQILRTLGQYIERAGMTDVRILETDQGLIVQGRLDQGERVGEIETYELSTEDIRSLLEDALARRGTKL